MTLLDNNLPETAEESQTASLDYSQPNISHISAVNDRFHNMSKNKTFQAGKKTSKLFKK